MTQDFTFASKIQYFLSLPRTREEGHDSLIGNGFLVVACYFFAYRILTWITVLVQPIYVSPIMASVTVIHRSATSVTITLGMPLPCAPDKGVDHSSPIILFDLPGLSARQRRGRRKACLNTRSHYYCVYSVLSTVLSTVVSQLFVIAIAVSQSLF
jgi:hypothetical protein